MSRIFISHSSKNNDCAVVVRDWLFAQGWDDVFLDLDPRRGIAAGDRWERALNQAALRCEAVLFLVSRAWLASDWCLKEFNLAHRLNKRLFGILIEDIPVGDLPATLTGTWQLVPLASGRDHIMLRSIMPGTQDEAYVTFSKEGLTRLRIGLERAGLDARFFNWPPGDDPKRPPYRGLLPLEAADAGIFFGREAPTIEALDRIRGMKDAAAPRLLVLLGASGAGKSSFLRAGLLPRLARDDRNFLPLPVIRPERAAINGEAGLLHSLDGAFAAHGIVKPRAEIREAIGGGVSALQPLLTELVEQTRIPLGGEETGAKAPTLVLAIDQGEELFLTDGVTEGTALLNVLRELLSDDAPAVLVIVAIRSDAYEQLQTAKALAGIIQQTLSLTPMPRGAYQAVIEGPPARLKETDRPLIVEAALTEALLSDIEEGGGRDALPLLAFTLERLYLEYGARGRLTLKDYDALGRIKGSIEAAVERAFRAADSDARIPRDRDARLALLRRGLIPWLAGIDPDTGSPRRLKARISEIPEEARPLIDLLVGERLLSTDVADNTGERTIEPAHEALLRQWGSLQGWLQEDFAALTNLGAVKRAARDWAANVGGEDWLAHRASRLEDAEKLLLRVDLASNLDATDRAYLAACREKEKNAVARDRRSRWLRIGAVAAVVPILAGFGVAYLTLQRDFAAGSFRLAVTSAENFSRATLNSFNLGRVTTEGALELHKAATETYMGASELKQTSETQSLRTTWLITAADLNDALGQKRSARAALEEAASNARKYLTQEPDDRRWRELLYGSLFRLGDFNLDESFPNRDPKLLDLASAQYEESQFIAQQLLLSDITGPSADIGLDALAKRRFDLAFATNKVGEARQVRGDIEGALGKYHEALELATMIEGSARLEWKLLSATTRIKIASALMAQTPPDSIGALQNYSVAIEKVNAILAGDPTSNIIRSNLAAAHEGRARLFERSQSFDQAFADYTNAVKLFSRLVDDDARDIKWLEQLARVYRKFGTALEDYARSRNEPLDRAAEQYRGEVAAREKLAQRDPTDLASQKNLRGSRERLQRVMALAAAPPENSNSPKSGGTR
jgi:hypothetical protein